MSDIGASLVDKLPWSKQLKSLVPELSQSMGPNPRVNLPLHARPPQSVRFELAHQLVGNLGPSFQLITIPMGTEKTIPKTPLFTGF